MPLDTQDPEQKTPETPSWWRTRATASSGPGRAHREQATPSALSQLQQLWFCMVFCPQLPPATAVRSQKPQENVQRRGVCDRRRSCKGIGRAETELRPGHRMTPGPFAPSCSISILNSVSAIVPAPTTPTKQEWVGNQTLGMDDGSQIRGEGTHNLGKA